MGIPAVAAVVAAMAAAAALTRNYVYACPHLELLPGAVVLITGSSQGIGEELAVQYARHGVHLVLAARKRAQLEAVAASARSAGAASVLVVPTDMGVVADVTALVAATVAAHGGLDVLLLNHAAVDDALFTEHPTPEDAAASLHGILAANVVGSAAAARAALPYLLASPRRGHIGVVSSATAKVPAPFHSGYAASKRALHGYFDSMRTEFHLTGINVTIGLQV